MQRVLDKEEMKFSGRKREHFKCTCCFRWNELVGRLFVLHLLFSSFVSSRWVRPSENPRRVSFAGNGRHSISVSLFLLRWDRPDPFELFTADTFFSRIRVLLPLFLVETERKENTILHLHILVSMFQVSRSACSYYLPICCCCESCTSRLLHRANVPSCVLKFSQLGYCLLILYVLPCNIPRTG